MSLSSAAVTAQTGLSTITAEAAILSQNIAGANDPGIYSRKIANVISALDGSQVASVTRASNRAVFDNLLNATSANAMQQALSSGLDQLNQTIGSLASDSTNAAATSPEALLSRFTNALQTAVVIPICWESSVKRLPLLSCASVTSAFEAVPLTICALTAWIWASRELIATARLLSTIDAMFGTLLADLGNLPA